MIKNFHQKYKALMLDVDGTIVINGGGTKISKKVKKYIKKSTKLLPVAIVSGRPLERLTIIFNDLGLRKPCIISGGAQIINPESKKILWEQPILPKDIKPIVNLLKQLENKIWVVEDNRERLFSPDLSFRKTLSFFIPKILEKKADEIISKLSHIQTLALTKVVSYDPDCIALHITHAGATKKHAVLKVAELLHVNYNEIIGIGDGYNDLPLFNACGLKVAVGNAVSCLKNEADYIAPAVEEDGVADVIQKFVLN